jgi:hypothetical protein
MTCCCERGCTPTSDAALGRWTISLRSASDGGARVSGGGSCTSGGPSETARWRAAMRARAPRGAEVPQVRQARCLERAKTLIEDGELSRACTRLLHDMGMAELTPSVVKCLRPPHEERFRSSRLRGDAPHDAGPAARRRDALARSRASRRATRAPRCGRARDASFCRALVVVSSAAAAIDQKQQAGNGQLSPIHHQLGGTEQRLGNERSPDNRGSYASRRAHHRPPSNSDAWPKAGAERARRPRRNPVAGRLAGNAGVLPADVRD